MAVRDDRDEVLDRDLRQREGHGLSHGQVADMELDPIDEYLVARIRVSRIYGPTSTVAKWRFMEPLDFLVGQRSPEEKRPVPPNITHVSIAPGFMNKIDTLIGKRLLISYRGEVKARCGLFGVPKPSRLLRVIFNAIPGNEVLEPLPGELRLFKLDDLARAYVCLYRRGTTVYILNLDYRHYYYQIPLSPAFWKCFVVHFWDLLLRPAAMPMGYRDACLLSQLLTLAILLWRRSEDEDTLGVELDGEVMPGMVPLIYRHGGKTILGAAFVLLDGILIMSHDQMFLDLWQKRLARNEKQAKVERKVAHVVKITATERHCQSCEETDVKCTTFAGVEFQPGGRCEPASEQKYAGTDIGPMLPKMSGTGTLCCHGCHAEPYWVGDLQARCSRGPTPSQGGLDSGGRTHPSTS
jgi:hypothetical protein